MIGGHACLHTEFIHGGDIPFPTEHKLSRLTTPPIEYMLNGYDDSALNGVKYRAFKYIWETYNFVNFVTVNNLYTFLQAGRQCFPESQLYLPGSSPSLPLSCIRVLIR